MLKYKELSQGKAPPEQAECAGTGGGGGLARLPPAGKLPGEAHP